jgi:site-specific DNA-cytosine methylase
MKKLILDLCCGLKGGSKAFKDAGWEVVTVDIEKKFNPTFSVDIRKWSWEGRKPDLIWCSPPCTEFSRESMPWCKTGKDPDMSIVFACKRIIDECEPKFWIMENVKGAVPWFEPYFGRHIGSFGPFKFWGTIPLKGSLKIKYKKKESYSSSNAASRSKIPSRMSKVILDSITKQRTLF